MNTMAVSNAHVRPATSPVSWLLCQTGEHWLAVPLDCVIETMRPLPLRAFPGVPRFVLGVSVIRGAVVPVIDVQSMLGTQGSTPARFVTIRLADRAVALAVDAVVGVRTLDRATLHDVPPLLGALDRVALSAIGTLDEGLLLVLGAARLVPDAVWTALAGLDVAEDVAENVVGHVTTS